LHCPDKMLPFQVMKKHSFFSSALNAEIRTASLELDGLDMRDYPDFCDAYFCAGERADGAPLTEGELESLTESEGERLNTLAHEEMRFM
jgi:hypothetical protein